MEKNKTVKKNFFKNVEDTVKIFVHFSASTFFIPYLHTFSVVEYNIFPIKHNNLKNFIPDLPLMVLFCTNLICTTALKNPYLMPD